MKRILLMSLCAWSACAQALNDPTRPPASLLAPGASVVPVGPGVPQLQSILIARHPGGRNIAVIDGIMLRPGDRYKQFVVERMNETEVVLANGKARQVLKLFPAVRAEPAAATGQSAIPR